MGSGGSGQVDAAGGVASAEDGVCNPGPPRPLWSRKRGGCSSA